MFGQGCRSRSGWGDHGHPTFWSEQNFFHVYQLGASTLTVNRRLLTDRNSCTNMVLCTHMCPAPYLYASNQYTIQHYRDCTVIAQWCLLCLPGPLLLLQSLSSHASCGRPPCTHPCRHFVADKSLHHLYQRHHNHWPLQFELPSDTLVEKINKGFLSV